MQAVQPQLPFTDGLIRTGRFDACVARLADRHYSRETHGSPQCAPPGELIMLRNAAATVAFGWVKSKFRRPDGEEGICCFLFRKEGGGETCQRHHSGSRAVRSPALGRDARLHLRQSKEDSPQA